IIAVLQEAETSTAVPELYRAHGISSATFYKWRSKFGGMDASLMSRMKELEHENRHLKKLYRDAQLSASLPREALAKDGKASAAPCAVGGPTSMRGSGKAHHRPAGVRVRHQLRCCALVI